MIALSIFLLFFSAKTLNVTFKSILNQIWVRNKKLWYNYFYFYFLNFKREHIYFSIEKTVFPPLNLNSLGLHVVQRVLRLAFPS